MANLTEEQLKAREQAARKEKRDKQLDKLFSWYLGKLNSLMAMKAAGVYTRLTVREVKRMYLDALRAFRDHERMKQAPTIEAEDADIDMEIQSVHDDIIKSSKEQKDSAGDKT